MRYARTIVGTRSDGFRPLSQNRPLFRGLPDLQGEGCHLIDETGAIYLDTRNNVAHCGHSHPKIVQAAANQLAVLNTNTRYLHPNMALLAERLAGLLPDPLEVVFFCNSGSEANDLALRLARATTGSKSVIVLEGAYHGHTLACVDASPYKWRPDTSLGGPLPHVLAVPCPDVYRGPHRGRPNAGRRYAEAVREACHALAVRGTPVGAFLVEGGLSVAGAILPPPGYLATAARAVREAGGLYIADEVQTGFGRLGTSMWAFQYQHPPPSDDVVADSGVVDTPPVPDIVTVGKPFGNGLPLAAVVTTRSVAAAFEACGVEYFNTFAGNPVCAAAGLAVLDFLHEEHLQDHAREVGDYLKDQLIQLSHRVSLIGDVRGSGLFLGIEFVRNRRTLEPADAETSFLCSTLKSRYRILTSIDGLLNNVLVVKPPMVFSREHADVFVAALERALTKDLPGVGPLDRWSKTPT